MRLNGIDEILLAERIIRREEKETGYVLLDEDNCTYQVNKIQKGNTRDISMELFLTIDTAD